MTSLYFFGIITYLVIYPEFGLASWSNNYHEIEMNFAATFATTAFIPLRGPLATKPDTFYRLGICIALYEDVVSESLNGYHPPGRITMEETTILVVCQHVKCGTKSTEVVLCPMTKMLYGRLKQPQMVDFYVAGSPAGPNCYYTFRSQMDGKRFPTGNYIFDIHVCLDKQPTNDLITDYNVLYQRWSSQQQALGLGSSEVPPAQGGASTSDPPNPDNYQSWSPIIP